MLDKMRKIICLLLAMMLLLTTAACGGKSDDEGDDDSVMTIDPNQSSVAVKAADNVFTLGYDANETLHPLRTESQANYVVGCLVYEFAVELDSDFNAMPNIITKWDTDNGFSWLFTVDTDITFHDGSKVTAADVAYSIDRARRSDVYSARLNKVWGISAMDEDTVMITLSDTNYLFPRLLNIPVVKKDSEAELPEGTGPYIYDLDNSKLVKYEGHRYADSTPIDVIYLHDNGSPDEKIEAYSTSVIDLAINDPTSLSRLGYGSQNEIRHYGTTNMQFIGFNQEMEFTCYQQMRYAMNYVVDREYICKAIYNGSAMAATVPISPENSLYPENVAAYYNFDLNYATQLFNSAGVQDYDSDGMLEYQLPGGIADIELDFVVCSDSTDKVKAAKRIVEDLASIGITAKLRQLSYSEYTTAIVTGNYDMFYGEIKLTADFSLIDMITTKGVKNFYKISDPNYYELIIAYLGSSTATERQNNCDNMCYYIAQQAPIIPICFGEEQVLTHRDVVSGMEPTQYNVFYNFRNWKINLDAIPVEED